jgi:sugar phosphate isomerase/epimerase
VGEDTTMKSGKRISISAGFDYDIPIEKQIPLIAQAGFTHISLGSQRSHFDYLSKESRQQLSELLKQYSLKIDTIHGPDAIKTSVEVFKAIAEAAVDLRVPVVVFHAGPFDFPENELNSILLKSKKICREINLIAQNTGITFALENVAPGPATELVRKLLLENDFAHIGFCYDSAHDQIDGPRPFDLLNDLKSRLVAVHLSDRIKPYVDHVIPWEGFIHWDELCSILKNLNIAFPLLFEAMTMNSAEKDPVKFLALAYERACRLYDKIFM